MLTLVTPPVFICYDRLDLLTNNREIFDAKTCAVLSSHDASCYQSEYGPSTQQHMYAPPTLTSPNKVIWSVATSFIQHRGIPPG